MSLLKYKYAASDTIIYQTDLYGGGDADLAGAEQFSGVISFDENMWLHASFKFLGINAIVDIKMNIYKALTNTFDGDELKVGAFTFANDASEDLGSFMLTPSYAPGFYRFGLQGSGSTTFDIEVRTRSAHLETS
jgi:hypothetical protein